MTADTRSAASNRDRPPRGRMAIRNTLFWTVMAALHSRVGSVRWHGNSATDDEYSSSANGSWNGRGTWQAELDDEAAMTYA